MRPGILFVLVMIFGMSASWQSAGGNYIGGKDPDPQNVTFLVRQGQSILVKGNLEAGPAAIIIVKGTLLVEGDLIINNSLDLLITGNGKLIIKGDLINRSAMKKNVMISGAGQLSIGNVFHAGENMNIDIQADGIISARKVVADRTAKVTGTHNFDISDCSCSFGNDAACSFCKILSAAGL